MYDSESSEYLIRTVSSFVRLLRLLVVVGKMRGTVAGGQVLRGFGTISGWLTLSFFFLIGRTVEFGDFTLFVALMKCCNLRCFFYFSADVYMFPSVSVDGARDPRFFFHIGTDSD